MGDKPESTHEAEHRPSPYPARATRSGGRMLPQRMRSILLPVLILTLAACDMSDEEPAVPTTGAETPSQPVNIVFIMSDDHAVQALSAYGHPVSKLAPTPSIDRIARDGVVFLNSFVTNSLCGPSRAALLTGKFGHINGFMRNGDVFDGAQPTWPRHLKETGYQTALIGKWHLSTTPAALQFDYWKIYDDQGEYYNPDFITAEGSERVQGYSTDLVTEFSLEWLEERRDPAKPFLLMVQHKAPHRNFMPALRHTQKYASTKFPVPDTYFDDYAGREAAAAQEMNIYRDMYEGHDLKMTKAVGSTELRYDRWPEVFARLTPEQRATWDAAYQERNDAMNAADFDEREMALWKYQRFMQDYLATIAAIDESVGAILDYLEREGLADNTLVVYTSDQGFYLGEHGWFDKRFMYEESLRTPLLMKLPGRIPAGSTSSAMVQNIDYAPTILEFAGVEIPAEIQGRSLAGIATGETPDDWRHSIYYQYFEYPGFHSVKRHYGVRSERYKLIHFYYDIDAWEFYDLAEDPHEMHNLIDDPDYQDRILDMKKELEALQTRYRAPDLESAE
ncbi:MAG: sulfatase family protein [Woeseiaceae bacterium]